jgi:hypothetical protein
MYGIQFARPRYYLKHPIELLEEIGRCVKYAYQRVVRGWDDSITWSLDNQLCEFMPFWIEQVKESKQGVDLGFFKDPENSEGFTDQEFQEAKTKYKERLDEIIIGFQAGANIIRGHGPVWNELLAEWKNRYPGRAWSLLDYPNATKHGVEWKLKEDFKSLEKELNVKQREEEWMKEQYKLFHRGMILFHQHFFTLWS